MLNNSMWLCLYVLYLFALSTTYGQLSKNRDELLNWCLDSKYHKKKPSEEGALYKQCIPWQKKACCTENASKDIHHDKLYNFNLHHCEPQTGNMMSEACQRHFRQDLCFYECEPHIGPWVVQDIKKSRKERFFEVPLCASDCDSWWNACKYDYTCTDNWTRNFKFNKSGNYCPETFQCMTFQEMFNSSKYFCESVWDHSWKYVPDNEACMRIWFNGSEGNPNERVAEVYIDQLFNNSNDMSSSLLIIFIISIISFMQNSH